MWGSFAFTRVRVSSLGSLTPPCKGVSLWSSACAARRPEPAEQNPTSGSATVQRNLISFPPNFVIWVPLAAHMRRPCFFGIMGTSSHRPRGHTCTPALKSKVITSNTDVTSSTLTSIHSPVLLFSMNEPPWSSTTRFQLLTTLAADANDFGTSHTLHSIALVWVILQLLSVSTANTSNRFGICQPHVLDHDPMVLVLVRVHDPDHPNSPKGHNLLLMIFLDGVRGVGPALVRAVLLLAVPEAGSLES